MSPIEHIRKQVFRLTQKGFAAEIGVAQPTVSRWENGVAISQPEMEAIRRLAFDRGVPWEDRWFFELPETAQTEVAA